MHVFQPASYKDSGIGWLGARFSKVDEGEVKAAKEEELNAIRDELLATYDLENIAMVVEAAPNVARGLFLNLKSIDADLVVLGTRGRTGLKGFFLGTTAESLIQTTPCSTLAVKPVEFLEAS
ncbi:MAG: universal stress protein [Akkermansiaceae bacterium]